MQWSIILHNFVIRVRVLGNFVSSPGSVARKGLDYENATSVTQSTLFQVRITFEERHPGDWGGFKPKVVVEYDERNNYLMAIDITYNRREADKNLGYNYRELKDKIQHELDSAQVPLSSSKHVLKINRALVIPGALACVLVMGTFFTLTRLES